MSEMIERVSRALYPEKWEGHDVCRELHPDYWAFPMEIEDRDRLLARARTAIEAMREPSKAMDTAGLDCGPDRDHGTYWRAMIDAALEP